MVFYLVVARWVITRLGGARRATAFAAVNCLGVYVLFYRYGKTGVAAFSSYLLLVAFQYLVLRMFARSRGWYPWIAFWTPIAALVSIRYIPASFYAHHIWPLREVLGVM